MEAQERHSPEPIIEETFLPQPSDIQLGSHHHHSHHPHLDPGDTSPSSLLHELTPEQSDLLKVQLQLHSYQQQRLHQHQHQHLHHHQHQHPFSLDDEDDDEHSRSPLEHHHHHHDDVLQIHPDDTRISAQDLTPTSSLHHLDFGHPVEFADGQGLQIHPHQPIYEDPTGGPYHLSQPFDLSSTPLSFEQTDLTDDVHSNHHHRLYSSHSDHHLSVQPVASSSTSSIEDIQPNEPAKKKIGRPGRKKSAASLIGQVLNTLSEGIDTSAATGNGVGVGANNSKASGGTTIGPGPTKRLRTVASLGDDMEKIEKLRAQGRERQRRKRERDRARAAGISLKQSGNPASTSIPRPDLDLDRDLESSLALSLYRPVQSPPRSSPSSDPTSVSLLTSQHNQPIIETSLPSIDPPPIFTLDDHDDQRQTTNRQSDIYPHSSRASHSIPSHLSVDLDARASVQTQANKILDGQEILQGLDSLNRSKIQVIKEQISVGNDRMDLAGIQQCLERARTQRSHAGEDNKDGGCFIEPLAPVQEADAFSRDSHLSVRGDQPLTNGEAINQVMPTVKDGVKRRDQAREDSRSEQSSEIGPTLTLDEWEVPVDLDLDRRLSSSLSQSDACLNGNMHPHPDGYKNRNGNKNETSFDIHHASLGAKGTMISEGQDSLHIDGLNARDGEHPEGLCEMVPSLSIPLLPYFCSG